MKGERVASCSRSGAGSIPKRPVSTMSTPKRQQIDQQQEVVLQPVDPGKRQRVIGDTGKKNTAGMKGLARTDCTLASGLMPPLCAMSRD